MNKLDEVLLYIYDKTKHGGNTDISNMDFGEIIYDLQSQNLIIFHSHTPHLVRISGPGKKYVKEHILNPQPMNQQMTVNITGDSNNIGNITQNHKSSDSSHKKSTITYKPKHKTIPIKRILLIASITLGIIYTIIQIISSLA